MQQDQNFNRKRMYITAQKFVKAKSFSGLILFAAAIAAMIIANSSLADHYFSLLNTEFFIGFSNFAFSMDIKHWVNDGLMTIFFLLAGLEITVPELRRVVTGLVTRKRLGSVVSSRSSVWSST